MPRVYLTQADREAAREANEIGTLTDLIKTAKGRTGRSDQETAEDAGISAVTFCNYKKRGTIASVSLLTARRIAHAVGCTKEQWLRIGGFK